jgi:hypothetical protein
MDGMPKYEDFWNGAPKSLNHSLMGLLEFIKNKNGNG